VQEVRCSRGTAALTEDSRGQSPRSRKISEVSRAELLQVLKQLRPTLRERFGVTRLAVFGSYARDTATTASDVDVLVEFEGGATFDRYFGVKETLEERLGLRVDLATPDAFIDARGRCTYPSVGLWMARVDVRGGAAACTCGVSAMR
jgi:predicted nucleotidyltransferase